LAIKKKQCKKERNRRLTDEEACSRGNIEKKNKLKPWLFENLVFFNTVFGVEEMWKNERKMLFLTNVDFSLASLYKVLFFHLSESALT